MEQHPLLKTESGNYGSIARTHCTSECQVDDDEEEIGRTEDEDTVGDLPRRRFGSTMYAYREQSGHHHHHHERISDEDISTSFMASTLWQVKSASLSVSMLARPSDDRRVNSALAGWNVSNLIQGTGILGVPYAVRQGGWAAVAMIFLVALLCCHTGKLLIGLMYETSKKTGIRRRLRTNYPEVGEACFGPDFFVLIGILQSIEMFSGCVMYLILLGTACSDLFMNLLPHLGLKEWAAINAALALPSLFITKMSLISWLSMISVFSLMSVILVLIIFTLTQVPMWDIANIPAFDMETFPIGFGIIVFSYTAHAVFPSIEGSMRKPQQFNTMMDCSFLVAAVVKACLGLFMVMRFGISTAEVATVNLHSNDYIFSRIATILVICNVILAIPLGMFVVSITFDDAFLPHFPHLGHESGYHYIWLLVSRPLLITLALFIAVMVPYFGLIMGVIGSFTGSSLCFLLPCIMHLKMRWKDLRKMDVVVDVAIIVFGVVAGLTGFVFSLKSLIKKIG